MKLAPAPATVLSPVPLGEGASSAWAQAGIAVALEEGDSPEAHARDTVAAGAGLVDPALALSVAREAAERIEDLARLGVPFDRDTLGRIRQAREAAHSARRVAGVTGDRAGRAIMEALVAAVRRTPSIRVIEGWAAERLVLEEGRVVGVLARPTANATAPTVLFPAADVVLATGGIGGLYAVTSNPPGVAGEGLGMAARAGALIGDAEFVQFHPTGLAVGSDPAPLISEAVRGEGAILIDETGRRFMPEVHADAELAPRDVVARAIHAELRAGRRVFLDARATLGERFAEAFPTVARYLAEAGIDPAREPIPVVPVQHYHMGGVLTDAEGRTSIPGLWAVGEVACTGLHGANRLASNSLLEAVVFAARAARAITAREAAPVARGRPFGLRTLASRTGARAASAGEAVAPSAAVAALRRMMSAEVGVERDAEGLRRALGALADLARRPASERFRNRLAAATLIAAGALRRTESRGAHFRTDFPAPDPAEARRTVLTLAEAEAMRDEATSAEPPVAAVALP